MKKLVFLFLLGAVSLSYSGQYTRRYSLLERKSFLLGPTGIRACGPHSLYTHVLAQRGHKVKSDFLVTSIDPSAPAEGLVFKHDVIVGANGKRFLKGGDPRVDMGWAIIDSEGADGKLRLSILRRGKEIEVTVRLKPIGKHSKTWPLNCPRTDRMVEDACRYLQEEQMPDGHVPADEGFVGTVHAGLFWLGTGDPLYLENARRACYWFINHITAKEKEGKVPGWGSWFASYGGMLIAEYYQMTGDKTVLPGLELCVKQMAKGQMPCGSWGHGYYDGMSAGYGEMNNAGLACWIALELARECEVKVDMQAINKARHYFGRFAVPLCSQYGDHAWALKGYGTSNGHIGELAVGHRLSGASKISDQFALKVARAFKRVEDGHTGCYFNVVWSPIAASLAPAKDYRRAMDQFGWYYALSRTHRGGFFCQYGGDNLQRTGSEYSMVGPNMTAGGIGLALVAPRRHLRILGGPKSVFLHKDLPKPLEEARKLHLANDWKGCQAIAKKYVDENDLKLEIAKLGIQLYDKSRYVQANVEGTLDRITKMTQITKLAKLSIPAYEIWNMIGPLSTVIGKNHPRLKAIADDLADAQTPLYLRGKAYYESCRSLKAQSYEPWWAYGRMAQAATRELVPKRRKEEWLVQADMANSVKILAAKADIPAKWNAVDFDDAEWAGELPRRVDTRQLAAVLMRTTFSVKNTNAGTLRLIIDSQLPGDTRVYLNGEEVVDAYSPMKGTVGLLPAATELLRQGKNVLAIRCTGKVSAPKVRLESPQLELSVRFTWTPVPGRDSEFKKLIAKRRRPTPYYDPAKDTRDVKQVLAAITKIPVFPPDLHGDLLRYRALVPEEGDRLANITALLKSKSWGGRLAGLTLMYEAIALPRHYHKMRPPQKKQADEELKAKLPKYMPMQKRVIALLDDPNLLVRAKAAEAVKCYGMSARDALPKIIAMLLKVEGGEWWVRKPAWEGFWRMDPSEKAAQDMISLILKDQSATMFAAVWGKISREKDQAVKAKTFRTHKKEIIDGVFDSPQAMWTRHTRRAIGQQLATTLAKDDVRPALPRFFKALSDRRGPGLQGSQAVLVWFGEESVPKLMTMTGSKDMTVQVNAIATLAQIAAEPETKDATRARIVKRLEAATKSEKIEIVRAAKAGLKTATAERK